MILDVGCGAMPTGDVNCDLYMNDRGWHRGKGREQLNPQRSWNFVLCSCEYLPFAENAFEEVVCNHVVEHMKNPLPLLCELLRVSSGKVTVRCPHWLGEKSLWLGKFNPSHKWHFNRRWFIRFGEWYGHGLRAESTVSKYGYPFWEYVPFRLPAEIQVDYDKRWVN